MAEQRFLEASSDVMAEVLVEAMETMAFICPIPPDVAPHVPPQALRIRIDFGLEGGEILELVAGEDFGRMLASNILAEPGAQVDTVTARDALRELVNVTCGSLLSRLGASPVEMSGMKIPVVDTFVGDSAWLSLLARSGTAVLDANGHTVAAWLGRAA